MKKWHKIAIGVGTGALACTGIGLFAAAPIACFLGGAGALGAASTGTVISTLSGVALTNASLAAIGGGAVAAGGSGIIGGTAVIATTAGVIGATSGGIIAKKTTKDDACDKKLQTTNSSSEPD